ncbi:hypothetical protein [Streptomyces sp. 8L]|uniref:hypothetical protein n=1 Tax=Streptomyces sp. 8L TaxID=2877242 RepID=UPI001CD2C29E|nr:hypothetical protein [Streptomyces sp. 8L]MCA1223706.1 hypothetical protein [Streptomyces sp. 8L]
MTFQPINLADPFTAQPGEILNRKRPDQSHVANIATAEAAARRTAQELENLTREYNQTLARLNRARIAASLSATELVEKPVVDLAKQVLAQNVPVSKKFTVRPVFTDILGRVTSRGRLTDLKKVSGTFQLRTGESISWVAATTYVDYLEDLFEGVPVVARAALRPDGKYVFQAVAPATREEWGSADAGTVGFVSFSQGVTEVIKERRSRRKQLCREFGMACMQCQVDALKGSLLSAAVDAEGVQALLCRSCKEDWRVAGRPSLGSLTGLCGVA